MLCSEGGGGSGQGRVIMCNFVFRRAWLQWIGESHKDIVLCPGGGGDSGQGRVTMCNMCSEGRGYSE